jgi:putative N6-adenine-specific DNA methylase
MELFQFAVPTLFGLEGLAAEELRRLGLSDVRAENGRVFCRGTAADLPRINLNLRTGERVLLVLGSFPAPTFDALFEGVRALPWERFISGKGEVQYKMQETMGSTAQNPTKYIQFSSPNRCKNRVLSTTTVTTPYA